MPLDVSKLNPGDHYEIYRNVSIWIAAEYMERGRKFKHNVVADARDDVDGYYIYIEEKKNREP